MKTLHLWLIKTLKRLLGYRLVNVEIDDMRDQRIDQPRG